MLNSRSLEIERLIDDRWVCSVYLPLIPAMSTALGSKLVVLEELGEVVGYT